MAGPGCIRSARPSFPSGSISSGGAHVPAEERIVVVISRTNAAGTGGSSTLSAHIRQGDESATLSPLESYDDSATDFARVKHVIYTHSFPVSGSSRHDHGDGIRGNIRISYKVVLNHGSLVGDGTVNASHFDSEAAADGEVLTADGAGVSAWEALPDASTTAAGVIEIATNAEAGSRYGHPPGPGAGQHRAHRPE